MKIGVADYGMNVWYGGLYDIEARLQDLKAIGYEGTERLEASGPSEALHLAGRYRRLGMDFSTCRGPTVQSSIAWSAALDKRYIWMSCGDAGRAVEFGAYCRRAAALARSCRPWGLVAAIHNHMGTRVETQQELEDFLKAVPEAGIVFDTGHLSMAGGNPVDIVRKYHRRIAVFHLKDVFLSGEKQPDGRPAFRFCELGGGNNGFDNAGVLKAIRETGWDGWIHVEHDHHLRDPLEDLKTSRAFIRNGLGI